MKTKILSALFVAGLFIPLWHIAIGIEYVDRWLGEQFEPKQQIIHDEGVTLLPGHTITAVATRAVPITDNGVADTYTCYANGTSLSISGASVRCEQNPQKLQKVTVHNITVNDGKYGIHWTVNAE